MAQVLTFYLGEEQYGLQISSIQEIVELPVLFYIPSAPDCYLGAMNFHGIILPVLDLPRLLDFEPGPQDDRVIVVSSDLAGLGLSVTRLDEILLLGEEERLPCDDDRRQAHCIHEVVDHNGRMINLLDVALLLARLEAM
jgi:purine-binding chemotaxis protein CheW